MSLHYEIQQLLASFNTPLPVAQQMASMVADLDRGRIAPGIEVGDLAPAFALPDDSGVLVRLSEQLENGPAVVTFFRGAWCPICNLQVAALVRAIPSIREAGGVLIGIHPDAGVFSSGPLPEGFLLLSDADQDVIRRYRLQFSMPAEVRRIYIGEFDTDVSSRNLDGSWNLPVPGTFVIDQARRVRRRHVTSDYTDRMEPDDILDALAELRAGAPAH